MQETPFMPDTLSPYLIEPHSLSRRIQRDDLILVDVGSQEAYHKGHLPGAIQCHYDELVGGIAPATGKLPSKIRLSRTLSRIGLEKNKTVVAYDHENNAKACRLLWTLDMVGHRHWALLNGGLRAWLTTGGLLQMEANHPAPSSYRVSALTNASADIPYILSTLEDDRVMILDARSPQEYAGLKSPSRRKGHIPGAVNLDWLETIDQHNARRLKSPATLKALLRQRNIHPDKEIIVHCQTHQRSSHSYVMLKSLGFDKIRAYDGSWSEWGNTPGLPIEIGVDSGIPA